MLGRCRFKRGIGGGLGRLHLSFPSSTYRRISEEQKETDRNRDLLLTSPVIVFLGYLGLLPVDPACCPGAGLLVISRWADHQTEGGDTARLSCPDQRCPRGLCHHSSP